MKQFFILITLILIARIGLAEVDLNATQNNNLSQIKFNLLVLSGLNIKHDDGYNQAWKITAEILRNIQYYVESTKVDDVTQPTLERIKRIKEIQGIIDPYVPLLLRLYMPVEISEEERVRKGVGDKERQGIANAGALIHYATPTDQIKIALINAANHPSKKADRIGAYSLLFRMGLDDTDIRREIVHKLEKASILEKFPDELFLASSQWGIKELVPFYAKLLQRNDFKNQDVINKIVMHISEAIKYIGTDALSLIPLLQAHIKRIESQRKNMPSEIMHGYIHKINQGIDFAEGKHPRLPLLSMNGSGIVISGTPQIIDTNKIVKLGQSQIQETNFSETRVKTKVDNLPSGIEAKTDELQRKEAADSNIEETEIEPSILKEHWGYWVVGLGIVLAFITGILFYKNRKV
jgi:hypothetical protein